MKEEKLKELGFKLHKEYTMFVDEEHIRVKVYKKDCFEIDLNFNEKTKILLSLNFCVKSLWISNSQLTFSELKQLDKILNK